MPIQWWCSATGLAWSWTWRTYPGVWLMVLGLGLPALVSRSMSRGQRARWLLGTALVWAGLDWPLGTLGAGYLLTAHAVQLLLLVYVAVPILLTGVPSGWLDHVHGHPPVERLLRAATHPAVAALASSAVFVGSHVPFVLDTVRPSQLGSCALDIAWLVAGLLLWWPVVLAVPARPWFSAPVKILYLFLSSLPCTGIGMVLTLTTLPLYALYELAPRVHDISARADQQAAGILMWVVAHLMTLAAISVVFFQWAGRDRAAARADDAATAPVVRP
jgi:cytochrome c oxidase assembly factor CtaG